MRGRRDGRSIGPIMVATLVLTGCTAGDVTTDAAADGDANGPSAAPGAHSVFNGELDPLRVLLAVIVLTTGDVDAAVAEGLVTPEELDVAEAALSNGEVSAWLARADLTLNGG